MKKMMILFAAAAMTLIPLTASAARLVVGVGPAFGPGYYGSYWGPGYGYGYGYPATGEVKIDTRLKDAEVFVNGAFAGTTKDAKTMHLAPGTYTIEVRHGGEEELNQQVFVAAGKTMHLRAAL